MPTRTDRLKKLVQLQEKLKAVHEARHAGYLASAIAAADEAAALARSADENGAISSAFPELYNRRIDAALRREVRNQAQARDEVGHIATATLRTNTAERAYKESRSHDERRDADIERLEIITRSAPKQR